MNTQKVIKNKLRGINYMVRKKKSDTHIDIKSTFLLIGIALVIIAITIATYSTHHING